MFRFCIYTDASSSEEGSSNFTSLENKYRRNASIPNGQTAFTFALSVSKARLAIFPNSKVRLGFFFLGQKSYRSIAPGIGAFARGIRKRALFKIFRAHARVARELVHPRAGNLYTCTR